MASTNHAPDSLKYQWRLHGLIMRSNWATSLDKSISFEIIDNYRKDRGNSRASLRYLEKATGALRPSVIKSLRRICEHDEISVARPGEGTRPTEYKLNFDLVAEKPSGIPQNTAHVDLSSGIPQDTPSGILQDTASSSSGILQDTETVLRTRLTAGVQEDGNIDTHAAATPPLSAGLVAADAGSARGPFDRFWNAFPRRYQKPKARAAWDKLNPDAELAERIIVAAGEWADHYDANPVDKKWMPAPANWLTGERYDEDLPSVYVDPKEAAIAKKKDKPTTKTASNDNATAPAVTATDVSVPARIKHAYRTLDGGDKVIEMVFETKDGRTFEHIVVLESSNTADQIQGLNDLDKLLRAVGWEDLADVGQLLGRDVEIVVDGDGLVASVHKPFKPSTPRPMPKFKDIVATTKWGGGVSKIGTASDDKPRGVEVPGLADRIKKWRAEQADEDQEAA